MNCGANALPLHFINLQLFGFIWMLFMAYNPDIHHRRSIRLQGYDYSQSGAYFVTICTFQRQHLFGEIRDRTMQLNVVGQMVSAIWQNIPQHFSSVELDEFILMPDHLHGIIIISEEIKKSNSLPTIIQNFKSISTRKINRINQNSSVSICWTLDKIEAQIG
jgi:REP element-mobilizing transposase RayT